MGGLWGNAGPLAASLLRGIRSAAVTRKERRRLRCRRTSLWVHLSWPPTCFRAAACSRSTRLASQPLLTVILFARSQAPISTRPSAAPTTSTASSMRRPTRRNAAPSARPVGEHAARDHTTPISPPLLLSPARRQSRPSSRASVAYAQARVTYARSPSVGAAASTAPTAPVGRSASSPARAAPPRR